VFQNCARPVKTTLGTGAEQEIDCYRYNARTRSKTPRKIREIK